MEPARSAPPYEVESRTLHAVRPGFRILELRISPAQAVPWHRHSAIRDTFYVLEGRVRIQLLAPREAVELGPGDVYTIPPLRPHRVANAGDGPATFLNLQGLGTYDFIPVDPPD